MKRFALSCCWAILISLALASDGRPQAQTRSVKSVVIIKFATHPALDETEAGVVEVLENAKRNDRAFANLVIQRQNANGNLQLAKQLAESASRPDVHLIVAIATPAAQAVARTPSRIPLIYGAVADPKGAGILDDGRATGIKNVGPNIIEKALSFMRESFPQARRLGTVYNPAEQNSAYVQSILKSLAPKYNFELTIGEVLDKAQVASATEVLVGRSDLIYSANDNTVNAAVAAVVAVTRSARKPFILGDLSTLSSGALAAVGLEYRSMGRDVGRIALQVLKGTPVGKIPPREAPDPQIWVNKDTVRYLGLTLPSKARAAVTKFVEPSL